MDQDALASKALAADDARVLRAVGGAGSGASGGGGRGEGKKMSKEERKKAEDKRDESKAGADVGKIVNLMAGDANRVGLSLLCVVFYALGGVVGSRCGRLGLVYRGVGCAFALLCGRFGCSCGEVGIL